MGKPAAKENDQVTSVDTHIMMVPSANGAIPTPLPHVFSGKINGGVIKSVKIGGKAAAVVGSTADNSPAHTPTPPGSTFQKPPSNKATIKTGSATVKIGGKQAARAGDTAATCHDPADVPSGKVIAAGTVMIGG
jgi:uncharacterized Zn-binding protein involved in type VI secretion